MGERIDPAEAPPPCGTKKAYRRHIKDGQEPDEACKQANRDYTRDHDRGSGYSKGRYRAYRLLMAMFPDVFAALLAAEEDLAAGERDGEASKTWRDRARRRAYRRLADLYAPEFEAIFTEEKAKARQREDRDGGSVEDA